jgi:hypothetical protein
MIIFSFGLGGMKKMVWGLESDDGTKIYFYEPNWMKRLVTNE